jgi:hypothetical protein
MSKRRKIILLLLAGYAIGLLWGQVRLPFAAVKSLADYDLIRDKPLVSASHDQLQMLAMQRWYLKRVMELVEGTGPPWISVDVKWNCGVVARVHSGLYISPMGAESLDGLYLCVFGAWFQVYGFGHAMAERSSAWGQGARARQAEERASLSFVVRPKPGDPNAKRFCNVQTLHARVNESYGIWHVNRACVCGMAVELQCISAGPVLEQHGRLATLAGRVHFVLCSTADCLFGFVADSAQRL